MAPIPPPQHPSRPSEKITAGELVLVCSRYDIGEIQSLERFKGGSRESPKVVICSDRGRFLLKRRAPGPADLASRVALSHEVQLHLAKAGFPVAPLIGTRRDNNSLLELDGFIYELFRFVPGRRYDRTPGAAFEAGKLLARLHGLLGPGGGFAASFAAPTATFHQRAVIGPLLADLPSLLGGVGGGGGGAASGVSAIAQALAAAYANAGMRAEAAMGDAAGGVQLVHGDWHPGNLLLSPEIGDASIVAVLDFDSVRLMPRLLDLANAAFQCAASRRTTAGSGGVGISLSMNAELFRRFFDGYWDFCRGANMRAWGRGELGAVPWLMIEAIIVETLTPIAATGRFGKVDAVAALTMARQAADWVARDAETLVSLAAGS